MGERENKKERVGEVLFPPPLFFWGDTRLRVATVHIGEHGHDEGVVWLVLCFKFPLWGGGPGPEPL